MSLSTEYIKGLLHIGGEWLGEDLKDINVLNPATKQTIGTVPKGGRRETFQAIEAADQAFSSWSITTAYERAHLLKKYYELLLANKEEIGKLITLEMGKPIKEAIGEVKYAASYVEWFAEQGKRVYGETIPTSNNEKRLQVNKKPVGVVAAITPWNFPAAMLTRKMAPALAAGCTILIKPSRETPLTAIKLVELAEQAGFPAGVINLVTGSSSAFAEEIMENQKVKKVTFTGSTEIGKQLMSQGANDLKKLSLELGGHAPIIVLDDADIDKAVNGIIASKFRNAGQTCICGNRIYVQDSIYESFIKKLSEKVVQLKIGDGIEESTDIGPLINQDAFNKVDRHVQDALNKGAELVVGGKGYVFGEGYYFPPTILKDVNHSMLVMSEETFGPVAPIQKIQSDKEAVHLANQSSYGLASYLFTKSLPRGTKIIEGLDYGIVGWNDGSPSAAQAPFGGIKESGYGKEGGHQGMEEYLEIQYVSIGL